MSDDARLKTALWVQACVRRASVENIAIAVMRKGDPDGGTVLVKLNTLGMGFTVFAESRAPDGGRAWVRGTGAAPVDEAAADAYIERNRRIDPDLWVVEIDDRAGRLPFDARIL